MKCPECRAPFRNHKWLSAHLTSKHRWGLARSYEAAQEAHREELRAAEEEAEL